MDEVCIRYYPEKFAQFGERVWNIPRNGKSDRELGLAAIERTKNWFREIGAPISLKEVGIGSEHLEEMASKAVSRGPLGSVKKMNKEDVLAIYKMSL